MTSNLHRFVYFSRNRISGSSDLMEKQIQNILASAHRNNERVAVTGALIFNSGLFAQVLEGDRQAIETIYEKIAGDGRHGEIEVLAYEPVAARTFPSWSMAFVGRSKEGIRIFGHLGEATNFEPKLLQGERIVDTLRRIFEEENHAA